MLIFKIVPSTDWELVDDIYTGSAHDKADWFLHFSTASQLVETLRRYYAGQRDLVLVAVDDTKLGTALKYEYAASRNDDFPHLYNHLQRQAVLWVRPIGQTTDGAFVLPALE